jgi:hypothetical protein
VATVWVQKSFCTQTPPLPDTGKMFRHQSFEHSPKNS